MKKLLLIILPLLLLSCSQTTDTQITISFSDGSSRAATAISDLGSVTEIKLYISEADKNYYLSTQEVVLDGGASTYTTVFDGEIISSTTESDYLSVSDDSTTDKVWILSSSTGTLSFYIETGLTRVFTVKVTYDTGEIFMGSVERTISQYTTGISIDVKQTAQSIAESTFSELEEFLDSDF